MPPACLLSRDLPQVPRSTHQRRGVKLWHSKARRLQTAREQQRWPPALVAAAGMHSQTVESWTASMAGGRHPRASRRQVVRALLAGQGKTHRSRPGTTARNRIPPAAAEWCAQQRALAQALAARLACLRRRPVAGALRRDTAPQQRSPGRGSTAARATVCCTLPRALGEPSSEARSSVESAEGRARLLPAGPD
jgi:hypothetical protein